MDHVAEDSTFPSADSIPKCGYMLLYGANQIELKKDATGEAWADDMHLPDCRMYICKADFSESLENFGEVKVYDVIAVCNQYIKPGNYKEPSKKSRGRFTKEPVAWVLREAKEHLIPCIFSHTCGYMCGTLKYIWNTFRYICCTFAFYLIIYVMCISIHIHNMYFISPTFNVKQHINTPFYRLHITVYVLHI